MGNNCQFCRPVQAAGRQEHHSMTAWIMTESDQGFPTCPLVYWENLESLWQHHTTPAAQKVAHKATCTVSNSETNTVYKCNTSQTTSPRTNVIFPAISLETCLKIRRNQLWRVIERELPKLWREVVHVLDPVTIFLFLFPYPLFRRLFP